METDRRIATNTDTRFLKMVAVICMAIDHIGAVFFPSAMILRVVGRLAFPLFAYCTVLGCIYTRNIKRYLLRLLAFAVVSQPVYMWVFGTSPFRLNILYSLALGVFAVYLFKAQRILSSLLVVGLAMLFPVEYGFWGVALMLFLYLALENEYLLGTIAFLILLVAFPLGLQSFAVFALPLILVQTEFKPYASKWFFYLFYPVHLAALGALRLIAVR